MRNGKKTEKCESCTASGPMELASAAVVKRRAQVLKALGHPSRIRILEILSRGETCVCHIAPALNSDLSTVSRHLAVLRNAGIIDDDKRGLNVYYRIIMPCVLDFLRCIDKEKV